MNAFKKLISIFAACLALASCVSIFSFETAFASQGNGHTWGETIASVSPSCEEGGYEILLCTGDGCEEKLLVLLDALGHEETLFVIEPPTCVGSGTAEISCSRCGRVREVRIAALGHDFVTVETDEGTEEVCSRCGETPSEEDEYHKPFLWLIIVICVGAVIIAVAIVLGYRSYKKANAQEAKESETPSDDREDGGDGGEEDKDGDEDGENKDEEYL